MSSSVPGRENVLHNLTTSATTSNVDAERSRESPDSEDDLILDGDDLLDAGPFDDVGAGPRENPPFEGSLGYEARSKSNLFHSTIPSSSRQPSPSAQYLNLRARILRGQASHNSSNATLGSRSSPPNGNTGEIKNGGPLDWYVEGPGRRVGYDDLTAIDWIFEYTKERQRLRILSSTTHGLVGYFRQLLDASHVWVVLIFTGISVGIVAAAINIASDWLGDIKFGYCKQGEQGGQFYLNKGFCCWGHNGFSQCQDWMPWRQALHIPSKGGGYVVEYLFYILFSVFFASCAAILVKHYAIYAKHSGIPEIKTVLGGFVMRRFMGPWTLVTKSLGLCLAVASGLWLGKEGPLVHVACCCANIIMKPFSTLNNNEARKREVLSAAAAAGISVAFGSPVGGVLFSLEQLSYYFPDKTMWQSFVCAMIAAFTLQALNPFHTGKIVLYQVKYTTGWHGFELMPFIILGIGGGLYGGLFIKLNMLVARFRRSSHNPLLGWPIAEVIFIAVVTALVNFPNLFMRAQLSELVYYLFAECASLGNNDIFGLCKVTTAGSISIVTLLLTAAGLGFLLASTTFGLQLPAGVMLPSLAVGALFGRALGIVVELFQQHHASSIIFAACEPDIPCVTPGTYAIVGAASALAGVTRMTVSIVVIMFELTGALSYVLPIMVAVMLSKWIGDIFSRNGIYESWIQFNQYPYLDNRDDGLVPDVPVWNIMTQVDELVCINAKQSHTIESLSHLLAATTHRGYPVVTTEATDIVHSTSSAHASSTSKAYKRSSNILLGYISRTELSYALEVAMAPSNSGSRPGGRSLPTTTPCYFIHVPSAPPLTTLDLRPWMDQTPNTLNVRSSFQLAVTMFQKLGLRYLLFVEKGQLKGLLTKKDVWWALNAGEATRDSENFVAGTGVLREENNEDGDEAAEQERGLLDDSSGMIRGTVDSM